MPRQGKEFVVRIQRPVGKFVIQAAPPQMQAGAGR